ncbi:MAG: hypothetical protein NVSMB49_00720 [Ktedonobacteraceae bacterium]
MAHGITEISIPVVARQVGVSVPTVYRDFRTKRDLIEALGGYVVQKAGFAISQPPHSLEELLRDCTGSCPPIFSWINCDKRVWNSSSGERARRIAAYTRWAIHR